MKRGTCRWCRKTWPSQPVPLRPASSDAPHTVGVAVYFIGCGSFVKIGMTNDLSARMKSFETHSPFEIVLHGRVDCVGRGPAAKLEADFHKKFSEHHERREWFRNEGALSKFLVENFS